MKKTLAYLWIGAFFLFMLFQSCVNVESAGIMEKPPRLKHSGPFIPGELKAGWNLGNNLDSHNQGFTSNRPGDFETLWSNPLVTEDLIIQIMEAGFDIIRIPVTWYPHMDNNHQVNSSWMNRVQEVVNYCLDSGLYVIINSHHDSFYDPSEENMEDAPLIMETLWKQIGQRFSDYDDRLLFEGMNEPRLRDTPYEWSGGTEEARRNINLLNKTFVDTVRGLGGQNGRRYLLVTPYCARITEESLLELELPMDDRLIVSVHLYQPYNFVQNTDGSPSWSSQNPNDTARIDEAMAILDMHLVRKGIPVMITEFGAVDKQNVADRIAWVRYITEKASGLGISCIWWDNGGRNNPGSRGRGYSLINRHTGEWLFPGLVKALTALPR